MKSPLLLCCLCFLAGAHAGWNFEPKSSARIAIGSQRSSRMSRWAKVAAGAGVAGAVGWGVRRVWPRLARRNETSVEERLEALTEDLDKMREIVRRVHNIHTHGIARIQTELDEMRANLTSPEDQLGPLVERIDMLDSSLRAMKSQLEDNMIEVEGRTQNSMQRVQAQIKSEQDELHKAVQEIRSLVPEMQARINEEVMEKLKEHSEELLAAVQKQFES